MKIIAVNQFEFDNPSTEQFVEIALAQKSAFPFPTAAEFIASRIGPEALSSTPESSSFDGSFGSQKVRKDLLKFANICLPDVFLHGKRIGFSWGQINGLL